jgi:hypothetical protein
MTDNQQDTGAVSGLLTGVIFVGALAGAIKLADSRIPRPGSSADAVREYWGGSAKAARFSATGQLISTAMLARFTQSVVRLAKRSQSKALEATALAGGGLAVVSLTNAAVTHARLTGKSKEDDEKAVKMANRVFVSGGPIHGIGFGALMAALALAGDRTGDLPKPVVVAGLVSAGSSIASPLYFLWEPAGWLIPIGRFSGYIVSGIAGVKLAMSRKKA